jgi:hypothetical protein
MFRNFHGFLETVCLSLAVGMMTACGNSYVPPPAHAPSGNIIDQAEGRLGEVNCPDRTEAEALSTAIFRIAMSEADTRGLGQAPLWLTANQRLELIANAEQSRSGPLLSLLQTLEGMTGWLKAEEEMVNRIFPRRDEGGRRESTSGGDGYISFHFDKAIEIDDLLGSWLGAECAPWPNDHVTREAWAFKAMRTEAVELLRRAAAGDYSSHNFGSKMPSAVAYVSIVALARMSELPPGFLDASCASLDLSGLCQYLPTAHDDCLRGFIDAIHDPDKARTGLAQRLSTVSVAEMSGYWFAVTGDELSSPNRLSDEIWDASSLEARRHLLDGDNGPLLLEAAISSRGDARGKLFDCRLRGRIPASARDSLRSMNAVVANGILAEGGDNEALRDLFWGVDNGIIACGMTVNLSTLDIAQRTGYIINLLRRSRAYGGPWLQMAQWWIPYPYDLSPSQFGIALDRVLSDPRGVVMTRHPIRGEWAIVPAQ